MYLSNKIRTPDGTTLSSYHRHDYQCHTDNVTGEYFAVEGGHNYLRRAGNPEQYIELSIEDTGDIPIQEARSLLHVYHRGGEANWELLKNIPTEDLEDYLDYYTGYPYDDRYTVWMANWIQQELDYREEMK